MVKWDKDMFVKTRYTEDGQVKLTLTDLKEFPGMNPKVSLFSHARLTPGEEVAYHTHEGEFEIYYILTGCGIYNDNGQEVAVKPGAVTHTPTGCGHSLKNTGSETLEFIALIVRD